MHSPLPAAGEGRIRHVGGGVSQDEILKDYAFLESEDIRACLEFAAEHVNWQSSEPCGNRTIIPDMEKTVRVFSSFAEHDAATARADMNMTPAERIQLVIELRDRQHPDASKQGLARVCRVIELKRS